MTTPREALESALEVYVQYSVDDQEFYDATIRILEKMIADRPDKESS